MKSFKFLISAALIGALLTYSGCSSPAPAPVSIKDQQLKLLSKTWICSTATLQNIAQTGYVPNFQLTITGTPGSNTFGYTCVGRPAGTNSSPWPSSGTFTFGTDPGTQLTRDDAGTPLPVTYTVTSTQLQMTFTYAGTGFNGRVGSVTGVWDYKFGL